MSAGTPSVEIPRHGRRSEELWGEMDAARESDVAWHSGRVAALVYLPGDDVAQVAREAYLRFFSENGLSARAFPSLARFEDEVVRMTATLLHGDEHVVGNITSGGTESIVLGLKIARDKARVDQPQIAQPQMVVPETAHPAFNKGAHLLGIEVVRVPVGTDFRVRAADIEAAMTENTILVAGSAPNYPYGMVDPIPEMAALAAERGISFHVDACIGGFFLPFLERLGNQVIPFDFRVPGVTTISADLHKYGFAARGASTILCRNDEIGQYRITTFTDWPAGTYSTPTMAGSRPGGAIASAWAVMQYLGEDGYTRLTEQAMDATRRLIDGVTEIPGFEIYGEPDTSVLAFGSPDYDMAAVATEMERRGWFVHIQRYPAGIHLMLSPGHAPFIDDYLADLREAVALVARGEGTSDGREAVYG
ncbi:MAG: aspartate aminotransferase family protein [Thermomicrobiales bacterium]|nr:aspartate aminotransferase family protein [Thermomicrobiales bacterium]